MGGVLDQSDGLISRIVYRFARKYIAGNTTASMLKVVGRLNAEHLRTTVTFLNNNVHDPAKARYNTKSYMEAARQIARLGLEADISIRPSQIGYSFDGALFNRNIDDILGVCEGKNMRIWLEGENGLSGAELARIYAELRRRKYEMGMELYDKSGIEGMRLGPRDHVRIWNGSKDNHNRKGDALWIQEIAKSGASITVSGRDLVWLAAVSRGSGAIKKHLIFEMPLGYNTGRMSKLIKGCKAHGVYVPYGMDWVPYVTNRIAEGNVRKIAAVVLNRDRKQEKEKDNRVEKNAKEKPKK